MAAAAPNAFDSTQDTAGDAGGGVVIRPPPSLPGSSSGSGPSAPAAGGGAAAGAAAGSADSAGASASDARMPYIDDGCDAVSTFDFENPFLPAFSPAGDAQLLAAALAVEDGGKKNVRMLVDLLTTRRPEQVQLARAEFDRTYASRRDLTAWVRKRTRGNLKRLLMALTYAQDEFDAIQLHNAVSGIGTHEPTLIDVLCFRSGAQIATIKARYLAMFNKSLESAIQGDTTGDFENVLMALLEGRRGDELAPVDADEVAADAAAFQAATESKRFGTDDEFIMRLFTRKSHAHLKAVAERFARITKRIHRFGQSSTHHFEEILAEETSGNYLLVLQTLLHPQNITAAAVRRAVKGFGTDDKGLVGALVSAKFSPLRMHLAKHAYVRLYDQHMVRALEADSSGNFRRALRRLCATHQGNVLAVVLRENMCEPMLWLGKTNRAKVSAVLTEGASNARERADTASAFFLDYGVKLDKALKGALAGDHAKFLIALSTDRAQLDAKSLKKAMSGLGTTESVIIDVLTTRRPFELEATAKAFRTLYKRDLAAALESDTSGNFSKVARKLASGQRANGVTITAAKADELAQRLYAAGEKKWGTDDDVFIEICTSHSPQDLELVDAAYMRLRSKTLEAAITKECSGHYRKALLACVNPVKFIAHLLRKSMKGLGTNDWELCRLLAHRPPGELDAIKACFLAEYGKSLGEWIKGDTSGHYRRALLSYIGDLALITGGKNDDEEPDMASADGGDEDPEAADSADAAE